MKDITIALETVAAQHGVTRAEVEREIAAAIRQAMHHPDPQVRQRWKMLWPDGAEPTPTEFLTTLAMLSEQSKTAFPA